MSQPTGLVLAGGAGRRMGRAKGSIEYAGTNLAARAAGALAPLCASTLVSVRPGSANPAPGYTAVADPTPAGRGPLVGIDAAFRAAPGGDLLVLACDYPLVETDLLGELVSRAGEDDDLVMAVDGDGRDHPLVGLWRASSAGAVREALEAGRHKVGDLVSALRVRRLRAGAFPELDLDRALLNVNRPDDLESV